MSNEITVNLECSIEEIYNILKHKGFHIVRKFILDDTYFIPANLELKNKHSRDILKHAIILRDITDFMPKGRIIKLTFKNKKIDNFGNILSQSKIDCNISNVQEGKAFLEAIGYRQIMQIKENDVVYKKGNLEIAVKDIENGDKLLEIETVSGNSELDTVEKLIQALNNLKLPISTDTCFVKKAEVELDKILK